MGSVTFQAIDLPTSPIFRLWGLTMTMTRDIIGFTQLDQLAFVKKSKPIYSRPDIGWLTILITQLTVYTNRFRYCNIFKINNNLLICSHSNSGAKIEWDKIYFASIKKAVMVAVLLRLGFTGVIFTLLFKKLK